MRTPVRVVIIGGPKKGQEFDGLLMSELEVGTCPFITDVEMNPRNSKQWKLSEIRDLKFDTSNNCIYMDTASGNKYALYVQYEEK